MTKETKIEIEHEKDVAKAVNQTMREAKKAGFGEVACSSIATSVSELSRNILKFAGSGSIKIYRIEEGQRWGMEIAAEDEGPGIENLELALKDGYSTSGSLGVGLSGVERLMDEMEIKTELEKGTRVIARKWGSSK